MMQGAVIFVIIKDPRSYICTSTLRRKQSMLPYILFSFSLLGQPRQIVPIWLQEQGENDSHLFPLVSFICQHFQRAVCYRQNLYLFHCIVSTDITGYITSDISHNVYTLPFKNNFKSVIKDISGLYQYSSDHYVTHCRYYSETDFWTERKSLASANF